MTKSTDILLEIPTQIIDKSALYYNNKTSLWTLDEQLYSGYAVSFYEDSTMQEKFGILDGRKQNQAINWFPNGQYKQTANYQKGKLHGEKKSWLSDSTHTLISQLNYSSGKLNGEQKNGIRRANYSKN